MTSQAAKGRRFRELHERKSCFIIPNPYDAGTTRLLTQLGFEAIATSSAGFAFSLGLQDMHVGRELMFTHLRSVVEATELPVSADLENGFADDPRAVAETIRLAAATGIVGGSIEDATGRADEPMYALQAAVDRIRAAAEAARGLPHDFLLTARCENYLNGRRDLADTIRRLQAYQEAGADVLFAPGLTTREEITSVIASIDRPLSVVMGLKSSRLDLATLNELGVRRISTGGSLSRVALGAFLRAAREMKEHGTFGFGDVAIPHAEIDAMFAPQRRLAANDD